MRNKAWRSQATTHTKYNKSTYAKLRMVVIYVVVLSALKRIKTQEYGWCEIAGEAIGLKRLLFSPSAELSVEAQIRGEAIEKHIA
nr:hypothetical protein [Pseudomonas luteola]